MSKVTGRLATVIGFVLAATPVLAARIRPTIDGSWSGTVDVVPGHGRGTASGAFTPSGRSIRGTMTLETGTLSATFPVRGAVLGPRARLRGALGAQNVRWQARWDRKRDVWRGTVVVRTRTGTVRGILVLARDDGPAPLCGDDYFANEVMPSVIRPICAQCHVPGGLAQAAAFHVTLGDPIATARSALRQVNPADPLHSRLLEKPLNEIPHGGGQRIASGSPEEAVLTHWIELVTAPGCGVPVGGGGTGADLYANYCAGCHGTDAAGTAGKPSIRCATRVRDAVRTGRGAAMPSIPDLTDAQVTLIEGYLGDLCNQHGRPGPDLDAGNCSTCHGATATGGQNGLGVRGPDVHCSRNVALPVRAGQGVDMPAFPGLSGTDVAAIQAYLTTGFCPVGTATGAELFAGNCATCHGADAGGTSGAPSVRCATLVDDAIERGRGARMPSFPGFAPVDIGSVETLLSALCAAHGRTGADLYAGNCSTCHGATASGGRNGLGVRGPDIRCTEAHDYQEMVRAGGDGMPAFPALDPNDVTAITAYVRGSFCSGG